MLRIGQLRPWPATTPSSFLPLLLYWPPRDVQTPTVSRERQRGTTSRFRKSMTLALRSRPSLSRREKRSGSLSNHPDATASEHGDHPYRCELPANRRFAATSARLQSFADTPAEIATGEPYSRRRPNLVAVPLRGWGRAGGVVLAVDNGEGLCTHYGLPYGLGLRDRRMPELLTLRRKVDKLLSKWERTL